MKDSQLVPPRRRVVNTLLALAVTAAAALFPLSAHAQLASVTNSTAGATCTGGASSDGDCRNSVAFSTPNDGTTFTSRYLWNINADTGLFSTHDTSGNAQHNVSFTATAPGGYRLSVSTTRVGDMNRISDLVGCEGAADTSEVTGQVVTGNDISSGTLSLADPGSVGSGGGDSDSPFNQSSGTAQIFQVSNGVAQNHALRFTWNGSVRSNSCEAAVRQGESVGTTTGCSACAYAGSPARTQADDGHFVTVTLTSLCGNGLVDSAVEEQCDQGAANGTAASCCTTSCRFKTAANQCRASAGICDQAEFCTGSTGTCPADGFAVGGVCRGSAGVCDVAETCDGSGPNCPADGFAIGGECRGAADVCDVAETCDGSGPNCPADGFASPSTLCRGAAADCDLAEFCTGSSPSCPADALAPNGTECRAADGACDVAEACDGASVSCPADGFASSSTVCRGAIGVCDVAELCTGAGPLCPGDTFAPGGVECRPVAGACDVAEVCTGSSGSCPADSFAAASTVCRASAGDCDVAENCSGSGADCPADGFVTAGMACADDGEPCTNDACDGSGSCLHTALPDTDGDTVCDAQDTCTNVGGGQNFVMKPKSKVILSKVNTETTPGNDKLVLGGSFDLSGAVSFGDLDPQVRGARVVVKTSLGADVLDVQLPPGVYGGKGTRGWKTNSKGTFWQYIDKTAAPLSGIVGLKAIDRSKGASGGRVAVTVNGKNGTYPVTTGNDPLEAIVVLGNQTDAIAGKCGESAYAASDCSFNKPGNTLKCLR